MLHHRSTALAALALSCALALAACTDDGEGRDPIPGTSGAPLGDQGVGPGEEQQPIDDGD